MTPHTPTSLVLYITILVCYIVCLTYAVHINKVSGGDLNKVPQFLKERGPFMINFFTIWNFVLQIVFLVVAIADEALKGFGVKSHVGGIRRTLFVSLISPCSLLVASIFWGIWMIDRELIYPEALDDFYPSWINHTMHTFIVLPVLIELCSRPLLKPPVKNRSLAILATYCLIYQVMYFRIYFLHGVWLYPVYMVLSWPQRILFITFQFALCLAYQRLGIAFLSMRGIKTN